MKRRLELKPIYRRKEKGYINSCYILQHLSILVKDTFWIHLCILLYIIYQYVVDIFITIKQIHFASLSNTQADMKLHSQDIK